MVVLQVLQSRRVGGRPAQTLEERQHRPGISVASVYTSDWTGVHADVVVLREGLKLARKIGQTAPLCSAVGQETTPGSSVQSDDDWDTWIQQQASTEFHPSSSCAMLPRELGGVVDEDLKVYGLGNVRVADASVYPISVSAHVSVHRARWTCVGADDFL